tara:strand:- start:2364 stop:2540 length:177 start_codon:yes stop_codon:yes gene_type:complete
MAPFIRIALRVLAGVLMGYGLDKETADLLWMDPELVGVLTLLVTEGWYWLARKNGWAK